MKVKLKLIAEMAGVGLATVDRVLNQRGSVKPATARKVISAARELNWERSLPEVYRSSLRFEVLLGNRDHPYAAQINSALGRLLPPVDSNVTFQRTFVNDGKPQRLAEAIRKARCNAMIVYGQEHDVILEAIASVTSAGVPVVTMLSDLPTSPRLAYVGINHYKAGRASAYFLAQMARRPGPFVGLYSDLQYRSQADRIAGFRDGLRDYVPDARPPFLLEGRDDEVLIRDILPTMLRRYPEVAGLYNAGAVNCAVEKALALVPLPSRLMMIGHDLTDDTARMLRDGTMVLVIDQNIDLQVRRAIEILNFRFGLSDQVHNGTMVPFTLYMRENIR